MCGIFAIASASRRKLAKFLTRLLRHNSQIASSQPHELWPHQCRQGHPLAVANLRIVDGELAHAQAVNGDVRGLGELRVGGGVADELLDFRQQTLDRHFPGELAELGPSLGPLGLE